MKLNTFSTEGSCVRQKIITEAEYKYLYKDNYKWKEIQYTCKNANAKANTNTLTCKNTVIFQSNSYLPLPAYCSCTPPPPAFSKSPQAHTPILKI